MTNALILEFKVNGATVPVNGTPLIKKDKDGNFIMTFKVGTAKLDDIEVKFKEVTYTEPIKDEKPNNN